MFDVKDKSFLIFDTETEGLNHAFTRPWQLAFIVYEQGKKTYEYESYLKWPNLKVSAGAARATGFNKSEVEEKGREPKEAMDIFFKYLYDPKYYIVGHNILGYDAQIVNVARRELNYNTDFSFVNRIIDTNAVAKGIKLDRLPKEHENFIAWQYRILDTKAKGVKTRSDILCQEFKIPYDPDKLHEALYDVEVNYKILIKLLEKIQINL